MTYKRPESVLVVLYNEHSQVLVMQRNDDPDFWQSVTGTIEAGESPIAAAYREVGEETGVNLSPQSGDIVDCQHVNQYEIRKEWQHRYPPDNFVNTEYVFVTQIPSDSRIILTEHSAYEWLDKPEALARVWSPSNRNAILAFVPEPK
ncbi:MAG: dihydroneopterin triphosphate diphosphatase [Pseudomonadota bacterium]|jgi:dATP pyrophosphohydrolase|uniref:dATP pyrophosphohydrolase n=1 Tax=Marisediminitalea aggregata TaxID=634436 RepID=A0A1M5R7S4_9ALTE|nr:dihydroneopterin triphosphate diphosphatase [Marisediminitalea aggregata]MAH55472.1 dihydroneopterin triphosphate diphosphatase [Aestuariibacter sp.]MAP19366.1 dihydroneopterin triphosphate diphosphatase [Alteromonadaceae bacterium]MEC7469358.1 dihydroneopterin triphosphate diphosphatase [Pseudomonadota bacterium]BBO28394.1 NUDIX pyrophosphatase [Alteromonas sp. I4]HBY40245.1 dihydroneopterin triphosphate diphosphatase [Alteromonas sp.]|tara:strand:- start:7648 stop:8088 length:441 start_codon:yes stop_codon:yes gene_type:complete